VDEDMGDLGLEREMTKKSRLVEKCDSWEPSNLF